MHRHWLLILTTLVLASACDEPISGPAAIEDGLRGSVELSANDPLKGDAETSFSNVSASLPGGASSAWHFRDDLGTSNGAASGGYCVDVAAGRGAAIFDAAIFGQSDAYDGGSMVWVNGTQVGGNLSTSGSTATFSPVAISGLDVQITYELMSSTATARNLTTLTNPSGSDIHVTVENATNFGSDYPTSLVATSSGDAAVGADDRWIITDDASHDDGDPANTTVFFGPGSPAVTPSNIGDAAFSCFSTDGLLATYSFTVPARQTRALMVFHRLNRTASVAQGTAADFDVNPEQGSDLLSGLTQAQLARIVNWDFVQLRTVAIDIRPGSSTNPINLSAKGKLPVAILTDGDFDAATVDASSVTLGNDDGSDTPVSVRNNGSREASLEDVDDDGDVDLLLHFDIGALVQNGDLTAGSTDLVLNGTAAGGLVRGVDGVRVVP